MVETKTKCPDPCEGVTDSKNLCLCSDSRKIDDVKSDPDVKERGIESTPKDTNLSTQSYPTLIPSYPTPIASTPSYYAGQHVTSYQQRKS